MPTFEGTRVGSGTDNQPRGWSYGDTLFDLPGTGMKACSASSIAGMFIARALTAEIIAPLVAMGGVPPVLISANVDGSDEHNAAIQKRYKGRV